MTTVHRELGLACRWRIGPPGTYKGRVQNLNTLLQQSSNRFKIGKYVESCRYLFVFVLSVKFYFIRCEDIVVAKCAHIFPRDSRQ